MFYFSTLNDSCLCVWRFSLRCLLFSVIVGVKATGHRILVQHDASEGKWQTKDALAAADVDFEE